MPSPQPPSRPVTIPGGAALAPRASTLGVYAAIPPGAPHVAEWVQSGPRYRATVRRRASARGTGGAGRARAGALAGARSVPLVAPHRRAENTRHSKEIGRARPRATEA